MSVAPPLPVLVFDEQTIPAEHNFEAFHAATAPLFDTGPVGDPGDFHVSSTDYYVGEIVVSRCTYGAQTLRRTRNLIGDGSTDWLNVYVHHVGGMRGELGRGTSLEADSSSIGFVDFAEPFTAIAGRSSATWIAVPRDRIERAHAWGSLPSLARTSARGRVLDSAIASLWQRLATARGDDAVPLADAIIDTLNSVLVSTTFTPTDRDLDRAVRDFIGCNLDDPRLGVDFLRATFHCSRSSLYRLFEPDEGVIAYIRNQRLLRCFDELVHASETPPRVAEVATRWGFENPSHFHRLFKAKFGHRPSTLTRSTRRVSPTPRTRQANDWIRDFREWTRAH